MVARVTMDDPSDVRVFADMLTGHATRRREVADEPTAARAEGHGYLS